MMVDTKPPWVYYKPINPHKVGESGGGKCSTENMSIRLTGKAGSLSLRNSERFLKKIMSNDFLSLGALIRVCLYSQKMNGENKKAVFDRYPLHPQKHVTLTASIFRALVKSPATAKAGF